MSQTSVRASSSNRRGLRVKAAAIAIALGTLPVGVVGGLAYVTTDRAVRQNVFTNQEEMAAELADKLSRFMFERYGDVTAVASLPTLTDAGLAATAADKQALLNTIVETYDMYDSLALFDAEGRLMLRSRGETRSNLLNREDFQTVLDGERPAVSSVERSPETGELAVYLAAPLRDEASGAIVGVLQSRLPLTEIEQLVRIPLSDDRDANIIDATGQVFFQDENAVLGEEALANYALLREVQASQMPQVGLTETPTGDRLLLAAASTSDLQDDVPLNWIVVVHAHPRLAFAASEALLRTIAWGTLGTTVVVALLAIAISLRVTEPLIQRISDVVQTLVAASAEMAATVAQQERSSTQQAASLSQSTVTVDELSQTAQRSADEAENAERQAKSVLQLARAGDRTVDSTLARTNELRDRIEQVSQQIAQLHQQTQQIGSISTLVSDLANQTNMLALNASVEAVRAGDAGRGFAVVASEIRKLADQSGKSAEQIDVLLDSVQGGIATAVRLMQDSTESVRDSTGLAHQTAEQFGGVKQAIQDIVVGSQQIAATAQQQALAIEQLASAMNALDRGASETASSISQIRVGSSQLQDVAKSLQSLI